MFPARWYSATDRKSMSNNSSCARFEEKLHSTTLHSTGTHTEFPLTKVPDISITLSWMHDEGGRVTYRRITRRVCPLRDVFRVVRCIATIAKCNTRSRQLYLQYVGMCILLQKATHRIECSNLTRRAISSRNTTYCSLVTIISTSREKDR